MSGDTREKNWLRRSVDEHFRQQNDHPRTSENGERLHRSRTSTDGLVLAPQARASLASRLLVTYHSATTSATGLTRHVTPSISRGRVIDDDHRARCVARC